ncbi:S-Ena type endospore appendage [Vallitalea okinawensis]|uniref:S-Ena type endospore appendage n=1 Tax=Vallitalea okinawensis TaxID=2078660 RepID=UPI000CFDFBF5|nr:S-Ena type endospore appendage [Vallitalea okinawensis]
MYDCHYKKYKQLITEEICSKINQSCDGILRVIWKAIGVLPSGTVKIQNTSDCYMIVIIKRSNDQKPIFAIVPPSTEKIFTITCIISVQLACIGACREKKCSGCIGLLIHYPEDDCRRESRHFCNQEIKQIRNGL